MSLLSSTYIDQENIQIIFSCISLLRSVAQLFNKISYSLLATKNVFFA